MIINFLLIVVTLFFLLCVGFFLYTAVKLFQTRVPLISTEKKVREAMLNLAKIGEKQIIYELGSGFGILLRQASAEHPQNTFIGYELLRPAVWIARILNKIQSQKALFHIQDFFTADLKDADVILAYLWPSIMDRIYEEIWPHLKPGTKIISHSFAIKSLQPEKMVQVGAKKVYLYVKP